MAGMWDAIQLVILAAALMLAGLASLLRRGPSMPRPEWPPSPTWSSRRDLVLAGSTAFLLLAGVAMGLVSLVALVLALLGPLR